MAKPRSVPSPRPSATKRPPAGRKKVARKPARPSGVRAAAAALNPAAAVQAILEAQSRVAKRVWDSADAVVRESFKLYERDIELLKDLKKRAEALAVPVKKSELVRAGLQALSDMQEAVFSATLKAMPRLAPAAQTGAAAKPKKAGKPGKAARPKKPRSTGKAASKAKKAKASARKAA
jgi:hypothetical protein